MNHPLAALLAFAVLGSACSYNRVALRPVPDATAPENQRLRALRDLSPESGLATSYYRNGVYQGTHVNWLILGDGTRVEDPRDLLPAVELTSPAARYANAFDTKLKRASVWSAVGWGTMAAGLVTMLVPLMMPTDYSSASSYSASGFSSRISGVTTGLMIGGGIELLSIVPLMIGMFTSSSAQADRLSAFETYPRALQQRLALEPDDDAPPAAQRVVPSRPTSQL